MQRYITDERYTNRVSQIVCPTLACQKGCSIGGARLNSAARTCSFKLEVSKKHSELRVNALMGVLGTDMDVEITKTPCMRIKVNLKD